jgi:hypothetical protein
MSQSPPPTPEHEKLEAAKSKIEAITRFLAWAENKGMTLHHIHPSGNASETLLGHEELAMDFLEINPCRLFSEKKLNEEWQRSQQSLDA